MNLEYISFLFAKQSLEDRKQFDVSLETINFKLYRKIVTFRSYLNKIFRIPQNTTIKRLDNGVSIIEKSFKNKKIITVAHDVPLRLRFKI